ncbi:23S rRNA (pseudouridine(1915)-N(3))-methyltransferase RlmH [bacterium]|nr:23S rRNA (pseudouridine(1915)-N(3))-methyltransferase RlmH [bacterium]
MNIKIVAIGKIKEKYFIEALKEYEKRLQKFCSLEIIELPPEEISDESMSEKYKKLEGERILKQIKDNSFVITLEIKGKALSSEGFAQKIKELSAEGNNEIVFIIGGANGLDNSVSERADLKLSFSPMTFTHQMFRVILLEQIYRAFKINSNESYHR